MDKGLPVFSARTPFFGRKAEVTAIHGLLREPECRLLTLIGPGGIGKTRLALEAARSAQADFQHGVFFTDLQDIDSADMLPIAVLNALGIAPGQEDPAAHLVRYLADRRLLLVMDNFEHLLEGGALLTNLLLHAPHLKLMVTSRESLKLQEEWLYTVDGIDLPAGDAGGADWREAARSTSAVQMFAACARRVRPDFSLESELVSVVEICRLVEGMPLAIELAASWVRVLRCEIIAREIQENIRFLVNSLRNVPDRHRSILVVFESTWRMLSPEEQQAFKSLSVFRGGFDQAAAQQVARASLPVMLALMDKSLVHRLPTTHSAESSERFGLHELLRQFAQEYLAQSEAEQSQTIDRHCAYYLDFLIRRHDDLMGGRQQAAVRELRTEQDNVLAAWVWAAREGNVARLARAVQPMDSFFQYQSRFLEGASLFEQTLSELERHPTSADGQYTQAQLLVALGWYYIRFGQLPQARAVLETALAQYAGLDSPPPLNIGSDPLAGLSLLALLNGDYGEAIAKSEEVKRGGAALGRSNNITLAHYLLASARLAQGQYEQAREHAEQACSLALASEDEWMLAYGLIEWGEAVFALGELPQARKLYLESYRIRESFNDPEGMAVALNHLGKVALMEKDYAEAQRIYQQSHAIYATIFDRGGLITAQNGLGRAALALGLTDEARDFFVQALRTASDINVVPLMITVLISAAELLIRAGRAQRALEILRCVCASPACDQQTRQLAVEIAAQVQGLPGKDNIAGCEPEESAATDLRAMAASTLAEIETLVIDALEAEPGPDAPAEGELVEPLTEREIEILRRLSDGHSNQSIAEQLILSLGTVKWYTSQIYGKLQVSSRTHAVAKARAMGIL